jgi:hypothetical protein
MTCEAVASDPGRSILSGFGIEHLTHKAEEGGVETRAPQLSTVDMRFVPDDHEAIQETISMGIDYDRRDTYNSDRAGVDVWIRTVLTREIHGRLSNWR